MVGLCGSEGESPASTPSSGVFGGGIACVGQSEAHPHATNKQRLTEMYTCGCSAGLSGAREGARREMDWNNP